MVEAFPVVWLSLLRYTVHPGIPPRGAESNVLRGMVHNTLHKSVSNDSIDVDILGIGRRGTSVAVDRKIEARRQAVQYYRYS